MLRRQKKETLASIRQSYHFLLRKHLQKVLIWSQIFEIKILMDLRVLRSAESQNHKFSRLVSLSLSACVRVCLSVTNIIQEQTTAETSCLIFYICITFRRNSKKFYGDQKNSICIKTHKRILTYYGLWAESFVSTF